MVAIPYLGMLGTGVETGLWDRIEVL